MNISAILLVVLGVSFLGATALLLRREGGDAGEGSRLSSSFFQERYENLYASAIVDRLFGTEDEAYIQNAQIPGLAPLFGAERKRLALLWLSRVRAQMRYLVKQHAESVRASKDLNAAMEARVFLDVALFYTTCSAIFLLIQTGSLNHSRLLIRRAGAFSERVLSVVGA